MELRLRIVCLSTSVSPERLTAHRAAVVKVPAAADAVDAFVIVDVVVVDVVAVNDGFNCSTFLLVLPIQRFFVSLLRVSNCCLVCLV